MEEDLLRIASAPHVRSVVETLAVRSSSLDLLALSEHAFGEGQMRAAVNFALAAVVAGTPPSADFAVRLYPVIEETEVAIRLLGSVREGLVDALLESAASGRNYPERNGVVLFLAAHLAGDEPPDELLRRIRYAARDPVGFGPHALLLVGLAALETKDPDVIEVARSCVRIADNPYGSARRDELLRRFSAPVIDALPDEAPIERFGGFTIRKPAPKVGRNDLCSCGSGRKYKRCCIDKEDRSAELVDPSLPGGGRARLHASMTDEQFGTLHPLEVRRIDAADLPTARLVTAIEMLARFRMFEEAERRLAVLATRDDLPAGTTLDTVRAAVLWNAISARNLAAVDRVLPALGRPDAIPIPAELSRAILAESPDALARIEEYAARGLREPETDALGRLCVTLQFFTPALGILVMRGALDPEQAEASETLLRGIESARDALLLPPHDAAEEVWDILMQRHVEERIEASAAERYEGLRAESDGLRLAAATARARERRLKRELERREDELAEAREAEMKSREAAADVRRADDDQARRLAKIKDLQEMLSEEKATRRELRKQLDAFSARMVESDGRMARPSADDEVEEAWGTEQDETGPERLRIRAPVYARDFRDALFDVPEHVARDALTTAASLAAADPGPWASVKRIKLLDGVREARIGQHRILFRLEADDEIEFLRLIDRRDLEATLKRMG